MAVRPVIRMGDPRLRRKSAPVVDFSTPALRELIADLVETMRANDGAGIAAPQVGIGLRVVIFGVEHNPRYPEAPPVPMTVLVNPEIEILGDETEDGWEGCLSVPGMRGLVPRWRRIRYSGFDPEGHRIERVAEGFHARVVQHECDHLDGILYPDRIRDMSRFGFIEELDKAGVFTPSENAED